MKLYYVYEGIGSSFGDSDELLSQNISCEFKNSLYAEYNGNCLFNEVKSDAILNNIKKEKHYYDSIENTLISKLQEIKFYSPVNINDSRRIIISSTNCISTIQLLFREDIHLNVYFRSSNFDTLLPLDLQFLCSLPKKIINHLEEMIGEEGYEEVNNELINSLGSKKVKLNLFFGSLHRGL